MAVLFVEGFTGYPRESNILADASSLLSGGYMLPTALGNNSAPYYGGNRYSIVPDAIFADRNVLRMQSVPPNNTLGELGINMKHGAATNPPKAVLGFTVTATTPAAAKYDYQLVFGTAYNPDLPADSLMYTAAAVPRKTALLTEAFAMINFNATSVAYPEAGIALPGNSSSVAATTFSPNVLHHVEFVLEQDVNRVRMYLDGTLIADGTFPGKLTNLNSGFAITTKTKVANQPIASTINVEIGNLFYLAIDSVHTGPLGPGARVLEVAPISDADVQWQRDDSYASNAEVVAQNYNGNNFLTAMDAGTTDLFNMPAGVSTNATQIYGIGVKMAAKSLTDSTHAIKATSKYAGVTADSTEAALPLNVNAVLTRDMSVNPSTNKIWTPAEVSAGQFGYKLSK